MEHWTLHALKGHQLLNAAEDVGHLFTTFLLRNMTAKRLRPLGADSVSHKKGERLDTWRKNCINIVGNLHLIILVVSLPSLPEKKKEKAVQQLKTLKHVYEINLKHCFHKVDKVWSQ